MVNAERQNEDPRGEDRTVLHVTDHLTLKNIPLPAYGYEVNGKSAIYWLTAELLAGTTTAFVVFGCLLPVVCFCSCVCLVGCVCACVFLFFVVFVWFCGCVLGVIGFWFVFFGWGCL